MRSWGRRIAWHVWHTGVLYRGGVTLSDDPNWWRSAVVYQVYPRSFADADGDGTGDVSGIIDRLAYLARLGVEAIWVSPWYRSPLADGGYDVADYRDIHPDFGTLADADRFVAAAHDLGLRVLIDLVPNHCSDQHPWFRAALAAEPGSPERERFIFRDGVGPGGEEPPNNWPGMFGGRAWDRTINPDGTPGQWYLHLFAPEQPDWNWENPEVVEEFDSILRFWFDRGIDGFRIDVANSMAKATGLPDLDVDADGKPLATTLTGTPYMNQPHVHDILRRWRKVADSYADTDLGARVFVSEAWVTPAAELAKYVRPDELHTTFNFDATMCEWTAESQRNVIDLTLGASGAVGAPATWVLANHDTIRVATRYGRQITGARFTPDGMDMTSFAGVGKVPDGVTDLVLGRRARPRRGPAGTRPARWRVHLSGRRTRPRRSRGPPRRRPAGPHLGALEPHVPRPRRLPGADSVGGQRGAVRLRVGRRAAVAPPARPLGGGDRRGAGRRSGEPPRTCTVPRSPSGGATPPSATAPSPGTTTCRPTCCRSPASRVSGASSTSGPIRTRSPRTPPCS